MIQNHLGRHHPWTRAFRFSFGMDVDEAAVPAYQTRGLSALDLYQQTAILFESIINDKHREVIEHTLRSISIYKHGDSHA